MTPRIRYCSLVLVLLALWPFAAAQTVTVCEALKNAPPAERVLEGRDGWLFREVDLRETFESESARANIQRVHEALAAQGVTLVIVPVPVRALVYPEGLDPADDRQGRYNVETARNSYRAFVNSLRQTGVTTLDVLEVALNQKDSLQTPFFFRWDVHWTPLGAQTAFEAVATTLRELPAFARVPSLTFSLVRVPTEHQGNFSRRVAEVCGVELPAEPYEDLSVQAEGAQNLLEAAVPAITHVGASFSSPPFYRNTLEVALQADVLNASFGGGGPFSSLQSYLVNDSYAEARPAFLVWEFSVHAAPNDAAELRQVLPAIAGACAPETSLLQERVSLSGSQTPLLTVPAAQSVSGSRHFLYLELSDRALVNFDVLFSHQDGTVDTVSMNRSTRAQNSGRFFMALSDNLSPLQSVFLSSSSALTGTAAVRLYVTN